MRRSILTISLAAVWMPALYGTPIGLGQINLVSNQPGMAAVTDPRLVNPWGLTTSATSPFWIANNGSGISTVYNTSGAIQGVSATIPGDGSVTGVAFASGGFNSDSFLFASEDGTISGWRGALGGTAEILQTFNPANIYKGLDYENVGGHGYALLANFGTGAIDILKGDAGAPDLAGKFTDPNLPAGYAPFNVRVIGTTVYISYAQKNGKDDVPGAGHGVVAKFDANGSFLGQTVSAGNLNSPWGLAIAPAGFGDVGGALLVGNFGDGRINAYDPTTGVFLETLQDASGAPLSIDGLWALRFGNGGNGGNSGTLYFTAGPNGETNGLFGALTPVPEPATFLTLAIPALWLLLRRRRA